MEPALADEWQSFSLTGSPRPRSLLTSARELYELPAIWKDHPARSSPLFGFWPANEDFDDLVVTGRSPSPQKAAPPLPPPGRNPLCPTATISLHQGATPRQYEATDDYRASPALFEASPLGVRFPPGLALRALFPLGELHAERFGAFARPSSGSPERSASPPALLGEGSGSRLGLSFRHEDPPFFLLFATLPR